LLPALLRDEQRGNGVATAQQQRLVWTSKERDLLHQLETCPRRADHEKGTVNIVHQTKMLLLLCLTFPL
jgi:hypothetical protein